jgi:hypothetical protein
MAAAVMQEMGRLSEPPRSKALIKDIVEKKRAEEEDPNITKYRSRIIEPGEEAPDRERAPGYERKIYRT